MIVLDLIHRDLASLPDAPALVRLVLFQQIQALHAGQGSESLGGFVPDHLALETIGVDEDGFEVRDGFEVLDLAEDVGKLVLEQGRGVSKAWQ
jgi:hypothetical protein